MSEQLDLFDNVKFITNLAVQAYTRWLVAQAKWMRSPEECDESHTLRIRRFEKAWQEFAKMAGCNPAKLIIHAHINAHVNERDQKLAAYILANKMNAI